MNKEYIKKFISYYKPYKMLFFMDMLCALTVAGISLIIPLITRHITNVVLVGDSSLMMSRIIKLGLLMLGLVVIEFICNYFITYKGHLMGVYMETDLRNELFEHYQKLSFSFYDNQKVGQLMSRLTNDLFPLTELYHHGPEDLVISIIKIVGAFIILINVNIQLTLLIFIFIPIMVVIVLFFFRKMKNASKVNKQVIGDINATIEDNLSGIRVVKSFTNEEDELEKFRVDNHRFIKSKGNAYKYMAGFHTSISLTSSLLNISVIVLGALFISKDKILLGDLLTYLLYINNLLEPIKKLINFTEQYNEGITGFERFMEMMEINPDIIDSKDAKSLLDAKGRVRFNNVSFKYNDTDEYVLKNINLDVDEGEYIALVGESGVGKTTLCSLIPRFYDVSGGSITIDDINIKDVTLKSLRSNIGIVQQDVYLFAGTIMDNIRYGKPDASDEEIIKAAKLANAHDFISEFIDGYNTDIGQRGVKLSGGQKQRISIARVFLKNPSILIFDEATSALDNESEKVVQDSLELLSKNRTTFVIAHRLSTIRNAQRIIVLSDDGIKESGTHEELLKKDGIYSHLYNMQFN
ncbi:MAG: ABC transporter ATP-binding protein [Erysipelotrichaceae bacterium]|nr:ABC transporter ATP-binding protein [Erysipelotrichaceae bacterium]